MQVEIEFKTHGGRRKGAGRKRAPGKRRVPHCSRPKLSRHTPAHVTLRVLDTVGRIRRRDAFKVVRGVMLTMLGREDFRIIDLSIQGNHIHLVCEADDRLALSRGMQSFKIATARRLNKIRCSSGRVFADRYHEEVLRTPRQVRNAIAYVLNNWRRHGEDRLSNRIVDPYSTGMWFKGWREAPGVDVPPGLEFLPRREPRTWLLSVGWRKKHSFISFYEVPGPRDR